MHCIDNRCLNFPVGGSCRVPNVLDLYTLYQRFGPGCWNFKIWVLLLLARIFLCHALKTWSVSLYSKKQMLAYCNYYITGDVKWYNIDVGILTCSSYIKYMESANIPRICFPPKTYGCIIPWRIFEETLIYKECSVVLKDAVLNNCVVQNVWLWKGSNPCQWNGRTTFYSLGHLYMLIICFVLNFQVCD
jgi:hypothetical protein